jgi:hypothetical protein
MQTVFRPGVNTDHAHAVVAGMDHGVIRQRCTGVAGMALAPTRQTGTALSCGLLESQVRHGDQPQAAVVDAEDPSRLGSSVLDVTLDLLIVTA